MSDRPSRAGILGPLKIRQLRDAGYVVVDATDEHPTPEMLRAWADWFDDPNASPPVTVSGLRGTLNRTRYTPGYLLRQIADALEQAEETSC